MAQWTAATPAKSHAVGAAIRADVIGGAESEGAPVGIARGALRRYRGRRGDDGVVRQGRGDGRSALQRGSGFDAAPWRLIEGVVALQTELEVALAVLGERHVLLQNRVDQATYVLRAAPRPPAGTPDAGRTRSGRAMDGIAECLVREE